MASTVHHLPPTTPLFYMSLFAVGAVIMRGAGCTINDMWDWKMDAKVGTSLLPSQRRNVQMFASLPDSMNVERTKTRPLAAGDVTQFGALTFLGAQLTAGLAVLTQLNWYR